MSAGLPTIGPEARQRLARSFAAYVRSAQRRAEIARAVGDIPAWERHMNCASKLAYKAELLGA
jgi:hypothetical protein